MILLKEEMLEMVVGDHEDIEARGVGLDHLEGMERWDQWDLLDQGDSKEGMDYPPLGDHSLPRGGRNTPYFQCKFKYHWHGNFSTLSRGITESM